jgi:hypothetical protein
MFIYCSYQQKHLAAQNVIRISLFTLIVLVFIKVIIVDLLNANIPHEMLIDVLLVQVQSALLVASIEAKELKNQNRILDILIIGIDEFLNDNS